MIKRLIFATAFVAALPTGPAVARQHPGWPADQLGKEASIPFIRVNNLYNFEADGTRGVWLQVQSQLWYYAQTSGPCQELPFAQRLGVDTRFGGNSLDRTGTLLVDGQRCPLTSLVASDGPPPKEKKPKKG